MKRIVLGAIGGAALGFAIALTINEFIFAGPEYGNALLWAVVGAIVGGFENRRKDEPPRYTVSGDA